VVPVAEPSVLPLYTRPDLRFRETELLSDDGVAILSVKALALLFLPIPLSAHALSDVLKSTSKVSSNLDILTIGLLFYKANIYFFFVITVTAYPMLSHFFNVLQQKKLQKLAHLFFRV
jgi:hypothetical protein